MAVFRIEKNSDFTIMPNYPFRDMRLSFKGRGLLGTMLTLRDDWDYTLAGLIAISPHGKGNTFYLVIDHATGDVYFLNLVDEADLLALLEDEGYEAECDCKTRCQPGEVNTDCPVCRTDLNECAGVEPEPTPEPTEAPVTEPETGESGGCNAALLPILLIVVLGAGGAYYFLKVRKRKPDTSGSTDLDEYDFPDDDDEVK